MSTDLRTYRAMVLEAMRRAQNSHVPEVFENSGPDHAKIVLDVMLDNAKTSVDLIAGHMHPNVWSAERISNFVSRSCSGRVRVILDDTVRGELPTCSALNDLQDNAGIEARWFQGRLSRHLCVTDRSHVRLETNRITREASITFGDPSGVGERAAQIFESLWKASAPVKQLAQA